MVQENIKRERRDDKSEVEKWVKGIRFYLKIAQWQWQDIKGFPKMDIMGTWEEWLKCWEENNFQQIAISLLHIGPEVIGRGTLGSLADDMLRGDAIRKIGEKAHNVLVHRFLRDEPSRFSVHSDKDLIMEVIDFIAEPSNAANTEPYKSDMEKIVTNFWSTWLAVKEGNQSKFSSLKKILSERKEDLIRALVNNRCFDQILKDNITEAIPILKEKIFRIIDAEWTFLIVDYPDWPLTKLLKELSRDRNAWMEALEYPKSQEFEVALNYEESVKEEAKTLLVLIARR